MSAIIAEDQAFVRSEVSRQEAARIFTEKQQTYKLGRLADIPEEELISPYQNGDFIDLCVGNHLPSTGGIGAFKLLFDCDYESLHSPHIGSIDLYKTSGHYPYYADSMYEPIKIDEREFLLKPMNCPMHIQAPCVAAHGSSLTLGSFVPAMLAAVEDKDSSTCAEARFTVRER